MDNAPPAPGLTMPQAQPNPTTIAHHSPFKPIGDYLVEAGLLSPSQVAVALNDQAMTGMRFGEILAARGWVKEQTIEFIFDKIIEPERRSLQKSLAWQKPPAPVSKFGPAVPPPAKHRKAFSPAQPAAQTAVAPSHQAAQFKAVSKTALHHKNYPAITAPPPTAEANPESEDTSITTCNGVSGDSDFRKVSEDLVWIG